MKIKNQIINYFVAPPIQKGGMPRVFLSPATMNASVGKMLIEKQLQKNKDGLQQGVKLLHVCFDLDSERIYLPNASDFIPEQIPPLLMAAQQTITKDYGGFSPEKPIEGSPFSSIRVRSISSFGYSMKAIQDQFKDGDFEDLPVIEANLARMPTTVKRLPPIYHNNKNFVGGYIGKSHGESIVFWDEIDIKGKKRSKVIPILTQKTPFILIDISSSINPSSTEKEWAVLSGYRDYLHDSVSQNSQDSEKTFKRDKISSFADLYSAKRHLYLGWPFEEVCKLFFENVKNFGELINAVQLLVGAAKSLEQEGYKNPSLDPYYITFKIDPKTFPFNLDSITSNDQFDPVKQIDVFQLLEYDKNSGYIIIETPAYIESDLCIKILKAKSRPFISKYNPSMNTIDVKSQAGLFRELQMQTQQTEKIKALTIHEIKRNHPENSNKEEPQFRDDERSRNISLSNPNTVNLRKISEYYYACDHIKKMCEARGEKFIDLDVVVGPLEKLFGRGVKGGFMGQNQFRDSKLKIPHQLVKGIWVSPPIIAVDSVSMPSYAKQTETLIHEYSHNLFSVTNPDHEHKYNKDPKLQKRDILQYWELYLNDPDERLAHKEEIKYELRSGVSIDEIIRDKIGGSIDLGNAKINYPIALKFKQLVEEAVEELRQEDENNEKPN